MPVFVPNCRIDSEFGLPVWADLGCHEFKTCIEYDGGHHLTPEQQQYDARRDQRTREADWAQVKLNKLDLRKGEQLSPTCRLDGVEAATRRRKLQIGVILLMDA